MKKHWITTIILGLVVLIYFNLDLDHKGIAYSSKQDYTPEEIWAQRLVRKGKQKALGITKFDHPNEYTKHQRLIRTGYGAYQSSYPLNYKLFELQQAKLRKARRKSGARTNAVTWTERGPSNVPGRTRTLLVFASDATGETWLAGAVGGGIWKTTDSGTSWTNKTPDLPNIAVVTMAQGVSNPAVIYAGTGESFAGDGIDGDGIFKSTDNGESWTQLASTIDTEDFGNVNRIVVDPNDPDIVLAASQPSSISNIGGSGIFRSTNGGSSWTKVLNSNNARVQQIVATPGNFNVLYATIRGVGVLKSEDAGVTWTDSSTGLSPSGRLELDVSPVNTDVVYISAQGALSGNESDLYVSENAGDTWSLVLEANGAENFDFLGGQGGYDNTIVAHPYDEDIVYFGGVNLWKATIQPGTTPTDPTVLGVDQDNTNSFLRLFNFGGDFAGGTVDRETVALDDLTSVEIRFGPGLSQKAHRFTVGSQGAGVPATGYNYEDYVDVPFEVWDTTNDQQLMVSFRDQQGDGAFNLIAENTSGSGATHSREYIFVHKVDYSTTANTSIAQNGGASVGHQHETMYFFWPFLAPGGVWNPAALPASTMRINYGQIEGKLRITQVVSDAYNDNGGNNSFAQTSGLATVVGLHPDHHGLYVQKRDEGLQTFRIINTNDGGVYFSNTSTDPGVTDNAFTFAGSGYNTSQFYGIDKKPGADEYIGGMQDNGTWRSPNGEEASASTKYLRQLGGDGFEVVWNNADPNKIIGGSQFNGFARTLNGGETWINGTNGMTDVGSGNAPFITKITNSKSNPDVLFAIGASGVWVSEDFAASWQLTALNDNFSLTSTSNVKVSIANNNVVWAGTAMLNNNRLHVSTDGGKNFDATNNFNNTSFGFISGMGTHPTEESTAYALFSIADAPKVLRTTDMGQTWEDISGFAGSGGTSNNGFPDVAVYSILVLPHETNTIWVGTDIGVVESKDNGATWALLDDNLPGTAVWDMKVQDDQVVIATHGRGIWTTDIPELPAITFVPFIENVGLGANGKLNIEVDLRSSYDSTLLFFNNNQVGKVEETTPGSLNFNLDNIPNSGDATVQVKSYANEIEYVSNVKTITLFEVEDPILSYGNVFDTGIDVDFMGNGFTVGQTTGFATSAINSLHDYETNNDYVYQLKKPIIIAESNARFLYDDVAIVEPGENGSTFGDQDFYDFVVVEGSKDGITWEPIADGYDARFDSDWLARYNNATDNDGEQSLYVSHDIDLLDTFNPQDTVFFRFRLFSDPGAVGWGWIVDNLFIQEDRVVDPVGIGDELDENKLRFTQYPNPGNGEVVVDYELPQAGNVTFRLINLSGKLVSSQQLGRKASGNNTVRLDFSSQSQGLYILQMESGSGKFSSKLIIR